jgi:serine/arginine repetitive matrix protein 2
LFAGRKQKSTYPKGNSNSTNEQKSSTKSKHNNTNKNLINDNGDIDILDLGDLDLSQLRLTKKDLETLSTITPSLSKRLQEQLLAQLPPNQARKLSRTLSMQSSEPQVSKEFLRSHSTGGDVNDKRGSTEYSYDRDENRYTSGSVTPTNENEPLCKFEKDFYNRSNRPSEERSYRAGSHSGINCSASPPPLPPCYYETRCLSPIKDGQNPRNGYVSPSPLPNDVAARRKSLNRRISKFLRPDFYDVPISDPGSNVLEREKFNRECETQKILREIRDKSRERSVDRHLVKKNNDEIQRHIGRHRSMSRSKEMTNNENINLQPIKDKILDELNNLSVLQIDALPVTEEATSKPTAQLKEKVKKVKTKQPKPEVTANDNLDILPKPTKKESKLQRPKSYPIKTTENLSLVSSTTEEVKKDIEQLVSNNTTKVTRPKSFPHSKITPPKDAKKVNEVSQTPDSETQSRKEDDNQSSKPSGSKIAKKTTTKSKITKETTTKEDTGPKMEGSPEKKVNKGFLYSIGQKFEKLRDATKSKDKKSGAEPVATVAQLDTTATTKVVGKAEVKKKDTIEAENNEEKAKMDRISKIDAMIRNLRDRSVPRGPEITESGLIKRAVSVEEMPGTFNKCSVNKVLGLFKKIEKDNVDKSKKVLNAKSTSYIGTTNAHSSGHKERPKSSNFSSRHEEFTALATTSKQNAIPTKSCQQKSDSPLTDSIEDCEGDENYTTVSKRHSRHSIEKERLKNNRKALLLDFSQINENKIQNCDSNYMIEQGVDKINNNSNAELSSRQPYHHHHHHLVNNTNNSSMSTSTFESFNNSFRSPDDEPLSSAFDSSESYLSDDHISPSVSRKSSHHYIHAPSFVPVNDTVNDRIRRMSFYSRYNENKPRRISHIVGPAAKDYYSLDREPSEPAVSNRLASSRHHHEYSRSLTSNIPEPLKTLPHSYYRPMKYPLTNDYSKRRSSNLVVPTSSHVQLSSPITMYATMSRKIQPYSHRSISMLDSSTSGMNSLIREHTPRATTTDNGLFTR